MRAVHQTVATASNANASAALRTSAASEPRHSATNSTSAGMKLATAATPSRDNQELRHWLKARHARSGLPRCSIDEVSPAAANATPVMRTRTAAAGGNKRGSTPSATPSRNRRPYPQPETLVKKMTEMAGCMRTTLLTDQFIVAAHRDRNGRQRPAFLIELAYRDRMRSIQRSSGDALERSMLASPAVCVGTEAA